ncbi:hypothetical protein ACIBSV_47040 [Embleya sp. NPDC050154]|uniref:hypothetical protein n=1 Tax=Embleya sp. NPDC050154 TaxID=3363988 RepID=UPI00379B13EC
MTNRQVIRRELRRLGWKPGPLGLAELRKGSAIWYVLDDGDVILAGPTHQGRREAVLWFPSDIPSAIVVAACEAWAAATGRADHPAPTTRSH